MYRNDVMWHMNQERHGELLKMAGDHQLLKRPQVGRKDRLFVNIGDLLVDLGLRLKARYEPAAQWGGTPKSC